MILWRFLPMAERLGKYVHYLNSVTKNEIS